MRHENGGMTCEFPWRRPRAAGECKPAGGDKAKAFHIVGSGTAFGRVYAGKDKM
jgi:hypothetical protein